MLLSAQMLDQVTSVNDWLVVPQIKITQGDSPTVYLRLTNAALDTNFTPPGRRFMPAVGSALTLTFQNVNTASTLTKICTQPFAQDSSIWAFNVLSSDGFNGMYSFTMTLLQGTANTYGRVNNGLYVAPQSGVLVPGIPQSPFIDPVSQ